MSNLRIALSVLLACSCLFLSNANAQFQQAESDTTIELPADITQAQVDDLVARLSDQQVRELLIRQLDKVAIADGENAEPSTVDAFSAGLTQLRRNLKTMISRSADLYTVPSSIWSRVTANGAYSGFDVLWRLLFCFVVGVVAEYFFRRLVGRTAQSNAPEKPLAFKRRARIALLRGTVGLLSIAVFAFATACAWLLVQLGSAGAKLLITLMLGGVVIWRLVALVSRIFVAPSAPPVRLIAISDASAHSVHRTVLLLAALVLLVRFHQNLIVDLDPALAALVGLTMSVLLIAAIILTILTHRVGIATFIAGDRSSAGAEDSFGQFMAQSWHVFTIVCVLGIWLLALAVNLATGASVFGPAITSLIILALIPVADVGIRAGVGRFLGPRPSEDDDSVSPSMGTGSDDVDEHVQRDVTDQGGYGNVAVTNLRILLAVLVIFIFLRIWHIDAPGFVQALVGERFADALFNVTVTGLLAYALWSVISTAIQRVVGPESAAGDGIPSGEGGGPGGSRVETLLPLIKKFVMITLLVMFSLIVLSSLGVDIGPLIAGAGVLGLAIGFGAQTLVKDIVSGFFFLLDDAFRIGERIAIGTTMGVVEKISIRSLRLRHHSGLLHTVPFGEIQTLTNMSRDWAIMKFELRVPFETDIEVVRKLIKRVGNEMIQDEKFKSHMLEPLKSQGVNRMDDSALIIRCKFTSVPGEQYVLKREAFTRIQRAFEEKGIKFAPRRVIVETSSPEVTPQVAAAAAGSTDAAKPDPGAAKDEP